MKSLALVIALLLATQSAMASGFASGTPSAVTDNADVNVYDGLSAAGALIWASGNLKAKTDGTSASVDFWNLPFSDGLYIDIVDQDADVLVVYE